MKRTYSADAEIVFQPALTPLEAAMLPVRETRGYGALALAKRAFDCCDTLCPACRLAQRQKIWVR
ncbi:MAG: hypothetical protein ACI4PG_07595 [Candidatus Ventricola sp.]